ncbi:MULTISPECIES: type II toxin-antitoxin system PemK/MazF family toxin [Protofrankia]|uniref:mRNA interferase n=1 Tax=Candidatus Protofrankia datiscae TaxID=2716812 RepID=F8AV65_9ACTN|nr:MULTISPECIES: type II toxin-antitoxin system PemK/MazF family toxin [Protofrankia]AEH10700.1 transcriptional modulator of MazE/toxin, MazF [Candidatus Protofrankia datiscae]
MTRIRTGEVWLALLDPVVGHEQGGRRPVVVVSADGLHSLPIDMAIVVPLTGQDRGLVTQPRITGPATGLRKPSFARPEDTRAIDTARLERHLGTVDDTTLTAIRKVLRYFLDL